jgi:2-keto-4-pentenoate hydratase/2-oxohepta-3-ene-1,7-dioic acid hydratase in catechol pathway
MYDVSNCKLKPGSLPRGTIRRYPDTQGCPVNGLRGRCHPSLLVGTRSVLTRPTQGELSFIIGRTCKNLTEKDDPLEYVLGYTVGNDVSSRYWQAPDRSASQAGYAKSFDMFAPIGPVISSTAAIPHPEKLTLVTRVNGAERQRSGIDDLIFSIPDIIRFVSRGHTLEPGTVIMTGTPSGVAAALQPPAWLQDGDVVEIEVEGIGTLRNKFVFES